MAIDCSDVPSNVTYDCANPWGVNCTSKFHFDFTSLWNYTEKIQAACANDTRLFLPQGGFATAQNASLTQESCAVIAGSGWTHYSAPNIWNRITTWKFPLLQLVASFPRPPLNFTVECLVILHLLGDPIDTIKNLILKISTCQHTATHWKKRYETLLKASAQDQSERSREERDFNWKALAIITDAYGEWDKGGLAQATLDEALERFASNSESRNNLTRVIRQTGRALAADRSTKFLPIVVAQIFFIGAVGIAIFRTAASAGKNGLSDTVFINVEAHSIAFSALYFWIIPAVFLSSIIGVSQTEAAIPRILRRFQVDLDHLDLPKDHLGQAQKVRMPNDCLEDAQRRIFHGGVYSWQPSRWQRKSSSSSKRSRPSDPAAISTGLNAPAGEHSSIVSTFQPRPSDNNHALLPYPILLLGTLTGMLVSGFVPPDGFDCRHTGELLICTAWILSAQADHLLNRLLPLADTQPVENRPVDSHPVEIKPVENKPVSSNKSISLLWITIVKDLLITCATMGGIVATQIGTFNRCSCYTQWGSVGLALPERSDVATKLFHRLYTVYPAITFTGIGIQLVIVPLYLCIWYSDALRVFLQRDDRRSNAPARLWKAYPMLQATHSRFKDAFSRFGRSTSPRAGTWRSEAEQGLGGLAGGSHGSQELHSLSRTPSEQQTDTTTGETSAVHETYPSAFPIRPVSQTESSSVEQEPLLPSRTNPPPRSEPRRRNTEPQSSTNDDEPLPSLPLDDGLIHRKPVSTASPLQHAHRDS